jgi:hypothetical protein
MTPQEIREAAEADLEVFIALVAPYLELGDVHKELIRWWTSAERKKDVLILLPRGHLKSRLMALKVVWEITRDPTVTILYVSATIALAKKQLALIKQVMESAIYQKYWPNMIAPDEGKRTLWTAEEIAVDHPQRKAEGVRDPTVKAAGLKTNITGFHATKVKFDDVVVPGNAYTEDGREMVRACVSQIASIQEPDSETDCVGTRYHGADLYDTFLKQKYEVFNEETGEVVEEHFLWDSFLRVVETDGVFLWPRKRRDSDGKYFGFNAQTLAVIKAKYEDRTQFFAQYYNNPNDPGNARIDRAKFQYYDRGKVKEIDGRWWIGGQPLNVYAGIDFAYSLSRKADFTTLAVIGVTPEMQYYVLDLVRFKTQRIKEYFDVIRNAYDKWGFKKLRAEVTVAQKVIVRDLKENYIVPYGMSLVVDEFTPTRHMGSKEERIAATLEPKYDNMQVWHYKGGETAALEDELVMAKPPHDDLKDALTAAIDIAIPPRSMRARSLNPDSRKVVYNKRFGGVAFR